MEISPAALSWLGKRGIGEETVVRFGLHTAEWIKNEDGEGGHAKPNPGGRLLVFPYTENGAVVGEKYRTHDKKIWQKPGSANVLFNVDVLEDENLSDGTYPLIWTEGEIDCLSAIEAGFPHVVSVPMGAPSVPKNRKPEDLDPIDYNREGEGDFAFMWRSREKLRRVRKHIIAVDNDAPGRRLAAELVRRLGPAKCSFVVYPEGCKDLNDVLMQHGAAGIAKVIAERKPYPVKGLFKITDYPDEPEPQTFPLGLRLDGNMKFYEGAFVVCTGVPSMGKSTVVNALLEQIAELHGAKIAIASFEAKPSPYLRDQFRTMYLRKGRGQMTGSEMQEADRWIDEHFVFIDHDPRDEDDDDLSLEWVIERAEDAVLRYGVRFLVLDPWNEIEHRRRREETIDDYTARAIRQLKRFCKSYRVCTIVVTHPTKDVRGKDGVVRRPGLYDISGSSNWYNKADIGFVVHREDGKGNDVQIHVEKVRHKFSGTKGEVTLTREPTTSRYVDIITEADIYHSEPL